jgi:hypothetical protein
VQYKRRDGEEKDKSAKTTILFSTEEKRRKEEMG